MAVLEFYLQTGSERILCGMYSSLRSTTVKGKADAANWRKGNRKGVVGAGGIIFRALFYLQM